MKYMYEILVPTMMDSGKETPMGRILPIRTRYHRVWDEKVRTLSGGLTILPPAKGQWVAPDGVLFKERMIPVRIVCTEEQIKQISDMTARYYKQQAILYYRVADQVVIQHYDKDFKPAN